MKENKKKNGLLLIVDCLRYDTLNNTKFSDYLFPNLSKLKKLSVFTPCYSNGVATQVALPSIFSLTYPLDYGGYENGIRERPKSFIECLKEQGYQTCLFGNGTDIGVDYYGNYQRGFDTIKTCPDFRLIIENKIKYTIRPKFIKLSKSEPNNSEGLNYLLKEIKMMCQSILKDMESSDKSSWSKKLYNHNKKIAKGCEKELILLDKNPLEIKKKILEIIPTNYWIFLGKSRPGTFRYFLFKVVYVLHFKLRTFFRKSHVLPFWWKACITVKSDHLLAELRKFMKSESKPWVVYCHLLDVHDSKDIQDLDFFLRKIVYFPKWFLAKLRGFTKRSFTYDSALMLMDKMLAPLIKDIIESKQLSDTVVIVTADHGECLAYSPKRKNNSEKDYFLTMHEELLKIPLLIYNPKPQIEKNYKLIDNMGMSATFLETLNVPLHESFKGISLYSGGRPIIISEHSGRGLPDLMKRGLYFTLTSENEKLFICIKEKELILKFYNLLKDPIEDNDLIDVEEYRPKILLMLKYFLKERGDVIANRFKKIKCKKFDFEIDEIN